MIDLAVLAILALAAWHGWRRGSLLMGLGVVSLVAGYLGAAFLYRPAGELIGRTFRVPPLIALPLGGMLAFFVITTIVKVATFKVERRRALARREGEAPNPVDSAGGAVVGVLRAGVLVVVVAWAIGTLNSLARTGPDLTGTMTGRVSARVMGRATHAVARRATGDPLMASMVSMMASQPREGMQTMNVVLRDQRVQRLWTDTLLRSSLAHGDSAGLALNATIRSLAGDPAFLAAAQQLGLLPPGTGSGELAARLVQQVGPLVRTVESIQNDAEIRRTLDSPELRRMMERGDITALLADPKFNELAGKILEKLRERPR